MSHTTQHATRTTHTTCRLPRFSKVIACLGLLLGLALQSMSVEAAVNIHGLYRLRTHSNQVQGDEEQYKLDTNLFAGNQLKHQLILNAQGTVAQGWRLVGSMNTALALSDNFRLQLKKANTELFIGTRVIESNAIGLLDWSRLLTGAQLTTATSNQQLGLQLAVGVPLGIPAKLQMLGIGRTGPYLLPAQHLPLVSRSERIYVDGVLMRSKVDYEIDYELGSIVFTTPVPIGVQIDIEYEYKAAQPRLTSIALGSWQEERMRVDFVVGQEGEWAPLANISLLGDPGWGSSIPAKQHMLGVGLAWQPFEHLWLTGSWLNTISGVQVAAAHFGGQWQTQYGQAGWDYRMIPAGFAQLGAEPLSQGYQELTAGYDVQLAPNWYSKLNVLRRVDQPNADAEPAMVQQKAEHVLTYVQGPHTLGWLVGVNSRKEAGASHHLLSTGVLATSRLGIWELEAEQQQFLRSTTPRPGDTLSRSRVVLALTDTAPYQGKLEWKQESRLPVDLTGNVRVQVWQATLASQTQADQLYWQLQGLYNTAQQKVQFQDYFNTTVGYLKGHAALPLTTHLTGQVWGEWRRQHDESDTMTEYAAETVLHYNRAIQGNIYAWMQDYSSLYLPSQWQSAAGLQVDVPLYAAWTYTGALDLAQENTAEQVERGWRQVHGLRWQHKQWQITAEWTHGLLEVPLRPSAADAEEQDSQQLLGELPRGHRLGLSAVYTTLTTHADLYVARDWEAVSKGWQVTGKAVTKVGDNDLKAQISHKQQHGAQDALTQTSANVAMQWALHRQIAMELRGQSDWRRSTRGQGDYQAIGVFSDLIVRF